MEIRPSELREIEYDYCRGHLEYFVEKYGHIEDKDADELVQPFDLWDEQRSALRQFRDNKLNVICALENDVSGPDGYRTIQNGR